ncbi:metallophosphoesterase [Schlesneria paludicola]|uniref:metallophosphoesterase n=1 Tax=Schlesneria paludicola TaxID=360056 RepID=UPI00029A4B90|nr:metallophosphoesterase [Schlesneria paludicola]
MSGVSRRTAMKAGAAFMVSALFESTSYGCQAYRDAKLRRGEPPQPDPGAFTLVVLPDTQHYSDGYPETFAAQTNWIVENRAARNIVGVIHLGDITDHNSPREWKNASRALGRLDGVVPYFLTCGNHDYGQDGKCHDRTTLLSDYFPVSRFRDLCTFGGVYDHEPAQLENSYHLLDVGDRKLMILSLEFGPRHDVVRWANEVVANHPDRSVILATHSYTYIDNSRHNWDERGLRQEWNPHAYPIARASDDDVMDGEELWTNLVSRHSNFIMTLNGHCLGDGLGRLSTETATGRSVEQMLVNFQMRPRGGDGWLRLLEFREDQSVQVYDYSPTRRQRNESPKNQFSVNLSPPAMT